MYIITVLLFNFSFSLFSKPRKSTSFYTSLSITNNSYTINFTIGSQISSAKIDQARPGLCFYLDTYNSSKSIQLKLIKRQMYNEVSGGVLLEEMEDLFAFTDSFKTLNLRFVHLRRFPLAISNDVYFGLGYTNDKNISFIYQLYDKKLIDYPQYTIIPEYSLGKGRIYFGFIKRDTIKRMKYQGCCDIISNSNNGWRCYINSIFLGDYFFNSTNYHLEFNVKEKNFIVPQNFFMFLKETYFKQLILNNQCVFSNDLQCNCDIIKTLPNIIFNIADYYYQIKSKYLFSNENNTCFLEIRIDNTTWRTQTFTFGSHLLKHFISSYDFNEKKILLYSNNIKIKNTFFPSEKIYLSINASILLLGLFSLYSVLKHKQLLTIIL